LTGNAASTQAVDAADVSGGDAAGQLLAGDLAVYLDNSSGLFTADKLARIQDATKAVDAAVALYGASVTETTDSTAANVTIDTGATSAVGGYADGILGCYTTAGEITLLQGWDWYAGRDPTQIGATQYDFQTMLTHELGHALGLGESADPTSAMYGTLAPGTTVRILTTADLNIPYAEAGADAQRAAPLVPAGLAAAPSGGGITAPGGGDSLFVPGRIPALPAPASHPLTALASAPGAGSEPSAAMAAALLLADSSAATARPVVPQPVIGAERPADPIPLSGPGAVPVGVAPTAGPSGADDVPLALAARDWLFAGGADSTPDGLTGPTDPGPGLDGEGLPDAATSDAQDAG
jgi:hypothetical protein